MEKCTTFLNVKEFKKKTVHVFEMFVVVAGAAFGQQILILYIVMIKWH